MKTIERIDPVSAGKVYAVVIILVFYIVFVPFLLLFGMSAAFGDIPGMQFSGFMGVIMLLIVIPFFYAIFGFIIGLLSAFIYNVTYRFHGGIKIKFAKSNGENITEIGRE